MGLIINKKINKLMKGYPTVSDKYNVAGGVNYGSTDIAFGDVVKLTGVPGQYEKATLSASSDIAGICLATNVKTALTYPAGNTANVVKQYEAFNLFLNGYVAVELDSSIMTETKAAVAKLTTDTTAVAGKDYYSREASTAGAGYLNDGSYAYTKETVTAGTTTVTGMYELVDLGSTNQILEGTAAYVTPAGKFCISTTASAIAYPDAKFTGVTETIGSVKLAEICVK